MKSIKQLQKEVNKYLDIMSSTKNGNENARKEYKKAEKKLLYFKKLVLYLETNPKKEFIEKEIERISNIINSILESYVEPDDEHKKIMTKSSLTKMKKDYEKMHNVPKLRNFLSTLIYIIK